jgi:hypothetical protein
LLLAIIVAVRLQRFLNPMNSNLPRSLASQISH